MSWLSDLLNSPKLSTPTLDPSKQVISDEIMLRLKDLLKGFGTKYSAGTTDPFTFRPTYNPKNIGDLNLAVEQGKIKPVGAAGTGVLDAYTGAGNLLASGGYDPAGKALAYEQITRGFDENMAKDLKSLKEMFGSRGLLKSSALAGKTLETQRGYGTAKGNALGQVALADLDKANAARTTDIAQQNQLDIQKWQALQQLLGTAGAAAGGSPFTPQSEVDYRNSLQKKNAWDNTWGSIINAAGSIWGA